MNNQMDYDLYVMSEIAYKDKHKIESDDEIFPNNWYSSKNYKVKTEIIAEAIEKNILVEETELYKNSVIDGMFD